MAKKQTVYLIEETHNDFQRLQEKLQSAKATRDEYNRLLSNARDRLRRREKNEYADKLVLSFVESLKKGNVLKATLIKAIDDATEINREFDDRTYKLYLHRVADDENIYKIFTVGSGWETRLDLQIMFEEVAGTLNDWAEGIDNYRQEVLKSKGLNNDKAGERATAWWYDNVYGTELNTKTITGRLALVSQGMAPFWQILNFGSSPMASDRPGGYNPVPATPTNFINDTELAIEKSFLTFMSEEQTKWFEETNRIKEIIAEHQEKRDEYSQEVNDLKTEMRLNEKILKSFDDKKDYIDKDILAKAIASMENDEKFKTRTINIAKKGSGLELLITVKKLEGTIEI